MLRPQMADLATDDLRAAVWERRLLAPVIVAAIAVLPLLALHLTQPHGALAVVETAGHWIVWLVFMLEVVVMLSVVRDRRAWIDGHRFELLVVALSSPLVPLALALAPALRLLIVVKAFKVLKLAKAIKLAKLGKSVRLLRRRLVLTGAASVGLGVLALALAAATVAYMLTGRSPLEGGTQTVAFVVAGMLATFGVNHLRLRRTGAER
jgi:hypothetical protein